MSHSQPFHVEAVVNKEGQVILSLPFAAGEKVEVVVVPLKDTSEECEWNTMALQRFLDGYADEDSVYDVL